MSPKCLLILNILCWWIELYPHIHNAVYLVPSKPSDTPYSFSKFPSNIKKKTTHRKHNTTFICWGKTWHTSVFFQLCHKPRVRVTTAKFLFLIPELLTHCSHVEYQFISSNNTRNKPLWHLGCHFFAHCCNLSFLNQLAVVFWCDIVQQFCIISK